MTNLLPPFREDTVRLSDGRHLGFAEYGTAGGDVVFWFHGTPGARGQVPPAARRAAAERGMRIIGVERPGTGQSSRHLHSAIVEWADDVAQLADHLEAERFGVIGLSGGGPYVLACAHQLPDRVVAGAVLGGVAPAKGEEAPPGGLVGFVSNFEPLLSLFRAPLGFGLTNFVRLLRPLSSPGFDLYMRLSPEGDQRVFAQPDMKEMFISDLTRAARSSLIAPVHDLVLFGRHWGFLLREIRVPIRFWHGDADNFVPLAHAEHIASLVPDSELRVRPGESHLGGLDAAEEVLEAILAFWPDRDELHAKRTAKEATASSQG